MESIIYAFVWKDKKEGLKRRVLIKSEEEGGLKVPSFKFIVDSVKLKYFFYKYLTVIANRYGHYWLDNILKQILNLDLSAANKYPELSTCTKNL